MPIGNEMVWWIVGLFVLVAVIILGIVFKPDFLQKVSFAASPTVHHEVMDAHSKMAKVSLNIPGIDPSKDDMQERINKEEDKYGHLSHAGKVLHSSLYTDDTLSENIYQHIDSSDPAPADSDRNGSLGSDASFTSPYSQNRAPFTKAHGHIHEKKWADDAVKIAHAAVGAAPSVIV